MRLSLLAIMQDERTYVDRWALAIKRAADLGRPFAEVLVVDGGSTDGTVERLREIGVSVLCREFDGSFSHQRNIAISHATTDWVFELDADEIPSTPLLAGLHDIATDLERSGTDCMGFARLNVLDGVMVAGPGHKGLDYQYRLHHRKCRWEGVVHEEITGYSARFEQPILDGHFIIHDKTAERHVARNGLYRMLQP